MKIFLNGEVADCGTARTIEDLIRHYELTRETTLVECNGRALHQREWAGQELQENDRLEILRVAAGG